MPKVEQMQNTLLKEQEQINRIIEQIKEGQNKGISGLDKRIEELETLKNELTKLSTSLTKVNNKLGEYGAQEFYDKTRSKLKEQLDKLNELDIWSKTLIVSGRDNSIEFSNLDKHQKQQDTTPEEIINKMELEIRFKQLNETIKANVKSEHEPELNDLLLNPGEVLKSNDLLEEKAKVLELDPQKLREQLKELDQIQAGLQIPIDELVKKLENISLEDMNKMLLRAKKLNEEISGNENTIQDYEKANRGSDKLKELKDVMKKEQNSRKNAIGELSNWKKETHYDKADEALALWMKTRQEERKYDIVENKKKIKYNILKRLFKRIFRIGRSKKASVSLKGVKKNLEKAEMIANENEIKNISNATLVDVGGESRRSSIESSKSNESEKTIHVDMGK